MEPLAAPFPPAALPLLPRHLLLVCLFDLVPPVPAAGSAGLQMRFGAPVQAAAPELSQLGLSVQLPFPDTLQPPGFHLPADTDALVSDSSPSAPGGSSTLHPAGPGAGLRATLRLSELHLAPAASQGAMAVPPLPQGQC